MWGRPSGLPPGFRRLLPGAPRAQRTACDPPQNRRSRRSPHNAKLNSTAASGTEGYLYRIDITSGSMKCGSASGENVVLDPAERLLDKANSVAGLEQFRWRAAIKERQRLGKPVRCLVLIAEDGDCVSDHRNKTAHNKLSSPARSSSNARRYKMNDRAPDFHSYGGQRRLGYTIFFPGKPKWKSEIKWWTRTKRTTNRTKRNLPFSLRWRSIRRYGAISSTSVEPSFWPAIPPNNTGKSLRESRWTLWFSSLAFSMPRERYSKSITSPSMPYALNCPKLRASRSGRRSGGRFRRRSTRPSGSRYGAPRKASLFAGTRKFTDALAARRRSSSTPRSCR
jgi:hypothetical protein